MPKRLAFRLLILLLQITMASTVLTFSLVATGKAEDARTIRIAVEGAFPPFNYLDSNKQLQGFDVDIANALCEIKGLKCELVVQEWTGMIPELLDDKFDAIISSMSMSEERRQKVLFTTRYYDSPSIFIAKKDDQSKYADHTQINGIRLGVTASTSQEAYAKSKLKDVELVVFPASPDLYKGLAEGEVDVILEDKLAIYDWLANTKAGSCCSFVGSDIKDAKFFGDGAGIAVRPDDKPLADTLGKALTEIQSNGTYDMINAKYFPFSIR